MFKTYHNAGGANPGPNYFFNSILSVAFMDYIYAYANVLLTACFNGKTINSFKYSGYDRNSFFQY